MSHENKGSIAPKAIVTSEPDRSGNRICNGTSDQVEINLAINSLTPTRDWREKVLLKGDFTIDAPIVVPAYTVLGGPAKITLANGSDCNMIENANPGSNDVQVIIEDLTLDGNRDNQAAGHGIYWRHAAVASSNSYPLVIFRNLHVVQSDDDGVYVDSTGSSNSIYQFENVFQRFADRYGFHLVACNDLWIDDCFMYGISGQLFEDSGSIQMQGNYMEGRLQMDSCVGVLSNDDWVDVGEDQDGVYLHGSRYCHFTNLNIRIVGSSAFVGNAAIMLDSEGGVHAINNTFTSVKAGRWGGAGTNRWNYIIEEADANQTGNAYFKIISDDYVTAVADMQGTGQKLDFIPWTFNPFNGAVVTAWGVEVDAATEGAVAGGFLPPAVHEVVFVVVDAMTVAGSGAQEMEIELNIDGAAGNEARNTHSTAIANLDSDQTGVAASDNITWTLNSRDYANLRALTALDRMRVQVLYETGADGDANTDAEFGSATLYYV